MTDLPSPSDRSQSARSTIFALVRPVLFAIGAVGLALGGFIATQWAPHDQVAGAPAAVGQEAQSRDQAQSHAQSQAQDQVQPQPQNQAHDWPRLELIPVVLADPEPLPPITEADFRPSMDLRGFQMKPEDPAADPEPPANERYELTLRLEKGDTVVKILADTDVPEDDRKEIALKLQGLLKKRKLATGETIELLMQTMPEQPDAPRVLMLSVRPQPEREYIVTRQDDGSYEAEEKIYKVSPRIVRVEAERNGSLQRSGMNGGAPSQAMIEFIRALSYDVDFQRELKQGQKFTVLLEQLVTSDGKVTHPGRLLAGELRLAKRTVTVIRFRPKGGAESFYNPQGESVVRSFLRTPMDASRITSRFGMREHPILGFSALHAGVDFAAPTGTPILAAGAGKVTTAGRNGGYGLYVRLQHTKEIATVYAHMSRLGPGIKPGVSVRQGQVVGFVGSTGMSTGPHLHYEFHRNGRQVNPLAQKFAMRGSVGGKDAARFKVLTRQYLNQLKNAPEVAEVDKPKSKPKAKASQTSKEPATHQVAKGD